MPTPALDKLLAMMAAAAHDSNAPEPTHPEIAAGVQEFVGLVTGLADSAQRIAASLENIDASLANRPL